MPYFLVGGTAFGRGRGDVVEALPDLAEDDLWLVNPAGGVSTRSLFESGLLAFRSAPHPLLDSLRQGRIERASEAVGVNDLQPAVLAMSEPVRDVYNSLVLIGMKRVRVSGSGATMFVFRSGAGNERESLSLLPREVSLFQVQTLSRSSIAARRTVNCLGGP